MKKIINVETLILDSVLGKIKDKSIIWPERFDFTTKIEFLRKISDYFENDIDALKYIDSIKLDIVEEERQKLAI